MEGLLYPIIGLAVVGGLYWVLTEMTRRQQRVDASLRKLEELAAEVTMEAGAVLEQADERIALLRELLEAVELKAREQAAEKASGEDRAHGAAREPASVQEPVPLREPAQVQEPVGVAAPQTAPGSSRERYQAIRAEVWALADRGLSEAEIARRLGIPRGEVQLMLNLRARRVTA